MSCVDKRLNDKGEIVCMCCGEVIAPNSKHPDCTNFRTLRYIGVIFFFAAVSAALAIIFE